MNIALIIIGILLFNFIIIAHEWGHFTTAKHFGVKVNEFALGMGPKLLSVQKGETTFSLRALPIGGYCAMEGEDKESQDPKAFETKKAWQKMIIIAAGAIMNLILGFLITLIILVQSNNFNSNTISKFEDNAISQSSGLQIGDEIIQVDSTHIFTNRDLSFAIATSKNDTFDMKVKRNGDIVDVPDVNFKTSVNESGKKTIKLDFLTTKIEKNLFTLLKQTFLDVVSNVQIVWTSLIGLLTGKFTLNQMSGPIGIASAIGKVTNEGLKIGILSGINNLLSLIAMITINLGIVNLLPLPALDGGRLVFLLFEFITGKKVDPKYEGWIHICGFALFILLTIIISFHDIMRLFKG